MTLLNNTSGILFVYRRIGAIEGLMGRKGIILSVGIIAGLLTLAHFEEIYLAWDFADAQLVWNTNEADVFVQEVTKGYRHSYLSFPFETIRQMLHGVTPPDKKRFYSVLLVLTPTTVRRFEVADATLTWVNPVDGGLFAGSESGIQRWTGNHFVPASPRETEDFENAMHSSSHGPDYDDLNGWSARSSILGGGGHKYTLQLAGKTLALEVTGHSEHDLSIDVLCPGQAPKTVWHLNERPRWVSEAEYDELFRKH
jgi:hypothetical protein